MIIKITINYEDEKWNNRFITDYLFFEPQEIIEIRYINKENRLIIWLKNEKIIFKKVLNYKIEEIGR